MIAVMARRRHLRPRVVVIPNGTHLLRWRHGVSEPTATKSKSTASAIAHSTITKPTTTALPQPAAAAPAQPAATLAQPTSAAPT